MTKAKGKPPTRVHSVTYRYSAEPAKDGYQVLRSAKGRPIADIEIDLDNALRAERKNIFVIGALLIEAKDKVAHGDWLPWLEKNFGQSESTAQNYMNAARLIAKSPTVRDLKLTPGAIYWLAQEHTDLFEEEVYEQVEAEIFKLAKSQWINRTFCVNLLDTAADAAAEESPTPDEPTPDEPTDDEDSSTPDELPPDEQTEQVGSQASRTSRAGDQTARNNTQYFCAAVDVIYGLIGADLEGANINMKKLVKVVKYLTSFCEAELHKESPEISGDLNQQVDRLKALWKSGRDKYRSFFAVLDQVRQEVGDDALAAWCLNHLTISWPVIQHTTKVIGRIDGDNVKADLAAAIEREKKKKRAATQAKPLVH